VAVGLRAAAGDAVAGRPERPLERGGLEEASVRALAKLQQLLPGPLRQRVEALALATVELPARRPEPEVDPGLLATIAAACRDHTRLLVDYRDHRGEASRRDVEPHRLVHGDRRWYLLAWDTGRSDWRTFRVDRITVPANHRGPRFAPRSMPPERVAARVAEGVSSAMWAYRAEVVVHAPAGELAARLPPAARVEPIDAATSRVRLGASTPRTLALYLGLLDVDITVDAGAHPDLAEAFADLADRYRKAAEPA
jgi:predicted DNA-binding transcriptional regulator YafY